MAYMNDLDALNLKIPRNITALMQLLQLHVLNGHRHWCGGVVSSAKLEAFVRKMGKRYPITRSTRGRTYDRAKHLAAVHLVIWPLSDSLVQWWLLSSGGRGGLADLSMEDAHVSQNAMSKSGHLIFQDYVLSYASKSEAVPLVDAKSKRNKTFIRQSSTWTWSITKPALAEIEAAIESVVRGSPHRIGQVQNYLGYQKVRPQFAGVRTQVHALCRYADDMWRRLYGPPSTQLWISKGTLPKMVRHKLYAEIPMTIDNYLKRDI